MRNLAGRGGERSGTRENTGYAVSMGRQEDENPMGRQSRKGRRGDDRDRGDETYLARTDFIKCHKGPRLGQHGGGQIPFSHDNGYQDA